ncbi:MAG: ABC transporter permease [Planctomycetes bacterium]|nr:ABC transporter permease [Planctomycetota bacterium]
MTAPTGAWAYRELFWFLVWRDVKVRYKQTLFGAAWAVLQPLMTMVVFLFIGKMANLSTEGLPAPVFWLAALVPWTYFANALNGAGQSLVANSQLLTKVWFPRVTLPAAPVLAGLVDLGIATVVLLVITLAYGIVPSPTALLWPLLVAATAATALGFGLIAAALNVRYRDVKYALPFLVQFWMFASPVLWSWDAASASESTTLRTVLMFNPMCGLIDAFRGSLVGVAAVDWTALSFSVVIAALVLALGLRWFHRTERAFADLV